MLEIIDVGGLRSGDPAAVVRVATQLGRACRDSGFFYVSNHGIAQSLLAGIFAGARTLFAQPTAAKDAISIKRSPHNRGYVGLSTESLDPAHTDHKEAFNVGLDLAPDDPEVAAGKPFRGVNLWPDAPGFRDIALAYFDAVWRLGCDLHRAIAADLGLPSDYFADKLDRPMATLRLLHYPPRDPARANKLGAGAHTDYGSITLLLTDDAGGLEVRRRDGSWIEAPPIAGTFVCNIGDCLMRWSNDIYVSTPHRVMNPPGRDRYSVAFFLDPNPDVLIACLPGCDAGRPAQYPPILAADYLRQRLDATYRK